MLYRDQTCTTCYAVKFQFLWMPRLKTDEKRNVGVLLGLSPLNKTYIYSDQNYLKGRYSLSPKPRAKYVYVQPGAKGSEPGGGGSS